ncbi:hypothetical protein [Dactylosporangium sp. CA-233914]|uniref:hypothetical protein n=1 Tax=Dactylosporangium sp. CA-233914 TaxID=3239934 RepID=UPI003D91C464
MNPARNPSCACPPAREEFHRPLAGHGVEAGPCGAAPLAALLANPAAGVVVLPATEGVTRRT